MKKLFFILAIAATTLHSCKPEPPKTLCDKIIQDIEHHPNDWHVQRNSPWLMSGLPVLDETVYLLNEKRHIKIEVYKLSSIYMKPPVQVKMLAPDTLEFYPYEGEAIAEAYNTFIKEPKEKRNNEIKDSLEAIADANFDKQKKITEAELSILFSK
jgi:hypothetical protein